MRHGCRIVYLRYFFSLIPAGAGMILTDTGITQTGRAYPRRGGDDPPIMMIGIGATVLSPQGRG